MPCGLARADPSGRFGTPVESEKRTVAGMVLPSNSLLLRPPRLLHDWRGIRDACRTPCSSRPRSGLGAVRLQPRRQPATPRRRRRARRQACVSACVSPFRSRIAAHLIKTCRTPKSSCRSLSRLPRPRFGLPVLPCADVKSCPAGNFAIVDRSVEQGTSGRRTAQRGIAAAAMQTLRRNWSSLAFVGLAHFSGTSYVASCVAPGRWGRRA